MITSLTPENCDRIATSDGARFIFSAARAVRVENTSGHAAYVRLIEQTVLRAYTFAIREDFEFEEDDLVRIHFRSTSDGKYVPGDDPSEPDAKHPFEWSARSAPGEWFYALAAGSERGTANESFCGAYEKMVSRPPLLWGGDATGGPKRLFQGATFHWPPVGGTVKVTEFFPKKHHAAGVMAVMYAEPIDEPSKIGDLSYLDGQRRLIVNLDREPGFATVTLQLGEEPFHPPDSKPQTIIRRLVIGYSEMRRVEEASGKALGEARTRIGLARTLPELRSLREQFDLDARFTLLTKAARNTLHWDLTEKSLQLGDHTR